MPKPGLMIFLVDTLVDNSPGILVVFERGLHVPHSNS